MGTRGPAPARSDQRRRRNKVEEPDKVQLEGPVAIPEPDPAWHQIAADWYRSLAESGQARYFEPSDWQTARYAASMMSETLQGRANGQIVAQIRGFMADLLTTESARRRASVELERNLDTDAIDPAEGQNVTRLNDRRKRLTDAS